jgi:predicted RNase H-like HicB family nuclease
VPQTGGRQALRWRQSSPAAVHAAGRNPEWGLWENQGVQNYVVIIRQDPEGGFWGEVPALPGCYSQGETVDELKHNIREAISGVLEVLREEGREPDSNIQILDVAV